MAQDEVFSGVISESVPTSISAFAHRRGRADSTASFTYYQEPEENDRFPQSPLSPGNDSAILDDDESEVYSHQDQEVDLEAGELATLNRPRASTSDSRTRLLRSDSTRTDGSNLGRGSRTSQKLYIVTEDLTIVIAGFRTSSLGFALYTTICVCTFGLGYLLLRWLPQWQVKIIGRQSPLKDSTWVVIEVSIFESLISLVS